MIKKSTLSIMAISVVTILSLTAITASAFEKSNSTLAETAPVGSLKDTVLSTLNFTPDIKSFQEYRQAAEHDLKRARSGWLPRVDARAGWGYEQWSSVDTRNNKSRGISQNDNDFYQRSNASLILQQNIWDGYATYNRYKMGIANHDSSVFRLMDNAEAATLDAVLSHIEVFRQRRLVALSELNVQNHLDILRSQTERQRLGAASMADVTQVRGRLARSQASLTETKSALEIAMANYKLNTGKNPGDLESPYTPDQTYPSVDVAIADTQSKNPKIKALQSDTQAAFAQKELDKANFHPQIYIEAGSSYSWQVQASQTYEWGTSLTLNVSWNLFDGLYDYYNVKGSAARMRQTKEQVNSQTENLIAETSSTWSSLLSAREQAKFFVVAVDNNVQTRDAYLQQFNVGQRSLLDVLDSENELYSSSMQLVTSRLNEVAAQYRLKALGGELLNSFGVNKAELIVETTDSKSSVGDGFNTQLHEIKDFKDIN